MTPEQRAKLLTRRALLIDVLIEEADPTRFADNETREGRGDRSWQKANAIKTAALIIRIEELIGMRGKGGGMLLVTKEDESEGDHASEAELNRLIKDAGNKVARIEGGKKRGVK